MYARKPGLTRREETVAEDMASSDPDPMATPTSAMVTAGRSLMIPSPSIARGLLYFVSFRFFDIPAMIFNAGIPAV